MDLDRKPNGCVSSLWLYIYIYIYRERERERERVPTKENCLKDDARDP